MVLDADSGEIIAHIPTDPDTEARRCVFDLDEIADGDRNAVRRPEVVT